MSGAAAYLQREDLGLRLDRVRLIGLGAQDQWTPGGGDDAGPVSEAAAAAAWITSRLVPEGSKSGGQLDLLCLDPDGSLCSWLTATSSQPEVVGVLARQGSSTADPAVPGSDRALTPLAFYAATPAESGVQALAATQTAAPAPAKKGAAGPPPADRIAVLATSDALARLLVDELDRRRVTVGTAVSLWQAMAAAWDPSAPQARASAFPGLSPGGESVVQVEQRSCTAVVLADPRGRVHWCWCDQGRLLAAGTIRVRTGLAQRPDHAGAIVERDAAAPVEEQPEVIVGAEDAARLTGQWLAWSVQLARVPSRIIGVMAEEGEGAGRGIAEFGRQLGSAWPGAALDLALMPDPIGATLLKLVDRNRSRVDEQENLVLLAARPTTAHRRFYTWAAAAMIVGAGVLGVGAWRLQRAAGELNASAQALNAQARARIEEIDPELTLNPAGPVMALEERIDELKREFAPVEQKEMPILKELDTLSRVVGIEGLQLRDIDLNGARVVFTVIADNLRIIDDLRPALDSIGGSHLGEWQFNAPRETRVGGADSVKYEATFTALWQRPTRTASTGGAP